MSPTISILSFSPDSLESYVSWDVDEILDRVDPNKFVWISCEGLDNPVAVRRIVHYFQLRPSRVEQILQETITDFEAANEDCIFYNYRVVTKTGVTHQFQLMTGSLLIGKNFLLTFEAMRSDLFDKTLQKIIAGKIEVKSHGVDHLLFLLVKEVVINHYYAVLRSLAEQLDQIEDLVLNNDSDDSTYREILRIRHTIKPLHRNILRFQEFVSFLSEEESPFIKQSTLDEFNQNLSRELDKLWRDYQELRNWISELIEIQRDNISSNTGKVIDRLSIISIIFLPLTFITGLYGMNFEYMPELHSKWGYPIVLLVMATIVISLVAYMKRKKWV